MYYNPYVDYMGYTPEPWAKEWLAEQRANGTKCLEVKVSNGNHYVYRSTSRYDPDTKGAKKKSEYIGVLDPEKGFIEKTKDARKKDHVISIKETGPLRLLDACCGDLFNILERRFPDYYDQLYAMALMRSIDRTPLKRADSFWEKFDGIRHICPALSPKSVSDMLRDVGSDREAQDLVFRDLDMNCRELALDLSEFFSESGNIPFAEGGYNPTQDDSPMINIAMVCAQDSGIPVMIRMIPGNVRDIRTVCATICEMERRDAVIVADHGFYSNENINALDYSGMGYIMPVKRNSLIYENANVKKYDSFEYRGRLIRFGKFRYDHHLAYKFEDKTMRLGEEHSAFMKYKDGRLTKEQVEDRKKCMGQTIIVSNTDASPEEIYLMFKCRDSVEKRFRTFKSVLDADSTYLLDNEAAFGHVFVTFLSMYMIAKLEGRIGEAGLLSKMSAEDVLLEYSKAYAVELESGTIDYGMPKKLEELDAKLGMKIFPILRS